MVGAFPEAGFGLGEVRGAVREDGPPPLAGGGVYQVLADVGPCGQGAVCGSRIAVEFPQPEVAHYGLGLHPPLAGVVIGAVRELFVAHGTIGKEAFVAGLAHGKGPGPHARDHIQVTGGKSAFHGQPGGLDVVPVGHAAGQHGPVALEVQLQVPGRGHHFCADNLQQRRNPLAQLLVRPHLIQVGIGLQDVQVGVHGFIGVDVVGRQGHVFQGREIPREGLHVAAVLRIRKVGFYYAVQVDGLFEGTIVLGGLVQLREAVNGKALRIKLLFGVLPLPFCRYAPVHAAPLVVAEVLQEPVARMHGGHQVLAVAQGLVGGRKGPDEAGIEDDTARGVILHGAVCGHLPVESPTGVFEPQPVRQDVLREALTDFLQE